MNKGRGQCYWTSTSRVTRRRPEPCGLVCGRQRAFGAREEMQALLEIPPEAGRGRYSGFFLHQSLLLAEPCRSPADNEFGECSLQSSVIRSRKGIGKQNLSEPTGTWLSRGRVLWNQRCRWHLSCSVVQVEEPNLYSSSDWIFAHVNLVFSMIHICVFSYISYM